MLEQRARDRQSLALTAGQQAAAIAYRRIEPLRQIGREFHDVSRLRRGGDRLRLGVGEAESDIRADRIVKQHDILAHQTQLPAQRGAAVLAYVDTIEQHLARRDIIKTRQQTNERALAAAGLADDGDRAAGRDFETDIAQHLAVIGAVCESDVAKFDLAARARHINAPLVGFIWRIENLEDARAGGDALLQGTEHVDQAPQRRGNRQQRGEKCHEVIDLHLLAKHLRNRIVQNAGKSDGRDLLDDRIAEGTRSDQPHIAVAVALVCNVEDLFFVGLGIEYFDDAVRVERLFRDPRDVAHGALDARAVAAERAVDRAYQPGNQRCQRQHKGCQPPVQIEQHA